MIPFTNDPNGPSLSELLNIFFDIRIERPLPGYLPYDIPHIECHGGLTVPKQVYEMQHGATMDWTKLNGKSLPIMHGAN